MTDHSRSTRLVISRRAAVVLLMVLAPLALLRASGAEATSDTTIGFDGLAGGTVVTNQYAASGIIFGRASDYGLVLGNSDCGPPLVTVDPTGARSAPNDATAPRCSASDSSSVGTFAAFSFARQAVRAYVGTAPGVSGVKAIMIGYDSSGTFVAFTPQTTVGAGANTLLSIASTSANIKYLSIYIEGVVGGGTPLLIDNVSVDNSAAPLTATGRAFSAVAGSPFNGVVGHIADGDPTATAPDYGVSLQWGDGLTSAGTVAAAAGGGFDVTGTHTYAAVGSDTVALSVTKVNGRTATGAATATVTSGTTTTTTTTPAITAQPPVHVSFGAPASGVAGQTVRLVASSSRPGGTYQWSVNGHELADCAGATSGLVTRTLPVGSDTVLLRQVDGAGASALAARRIVVRPGSTARDATARSVRVVPLSPVAVCRSVASDPRAARVAPAVAYAPGAGCTTQVKSGVIDAVGCLTEYQDTIRVTFARNQRGHLGTQKVTLPAGQAGLAGVSSAADTSAVLQDVENALNPPHPRLCVDSQGNDFICSTVGVEQQPVGPSFGGVPAETGGPVAGQAARAATRRGGSAAAAAGQRIAFAGDACMVAPSKTAGGESECLDLWVSTGPVRINGIDYAPAPGGEIVLAPQFNLLISQQASTSLDGLLLNTSHPFRLVDFALPPGAAPGGGSPGVDYPALTVPDLPTEIARQRSLPEASAIISKLSAVGGFPSVGGLEIAFDNDTAIVTLHVQLPAPFNGGDGPVTAAVQARIGPTEPFHVVYGYLGDTTGGSKVDLGPVALSGFGICFREHYSPDTSVDPCRGITNIDDAGFPDATWTASAGLNLGGALDVEFRPGSNSIPGCSQAIPLGFAFSGDGGLSQAGAALDLRGSGGIPIFPGVSITGLAAGFRSTATYNQYGGCVGLSVVALLSITGNVFGVDTVNGARYQFNGSELGTGVLQKTGGTFPYTNHVGIGVSGVASLTLPELPAFQVGSAYALYVDDPAAVFFGAGLDIGLPHGNFEDQPGTGIALKGGLKGAIGLAGGFPFDFEGYANFEASALSQTLLSGEAELIVSYSPKPGQHGGIGACLGLGVGNVSGSAGFAYHWGDTYFDLPGDINIGSCDNNWLDRQIGVNVQGADLRRGGPVASVASVVAPGGLNAVNFRVHSATGAPDITVTAPDGASATTAGLPLNKIVKVKGFTLVRFPTLHETIIAPTHPSPGRYRIVTDPGSPPVTRIDRLDGLRPRVSAHVNGVGTHRQLVYRIARQAGQSVTFFEISGQVHRSLGTTTGGSGTLAFTASHGRGRRQIVAEVYGDGVPRVRMSVTSYRAPELARLGRVRHLRVHRRRAVAMVSFAGVSGAREYRVNLALSDGTREVTTTRSHRATFAPVFVDIGGTISVRAVGNGLATLTGPPVRARLSPLFGRGIRRTGRPARVG